MMDNQMLNIQELRSRIKESRESYPHHWEASRKLMNQESLSTTLPALIQSIQEASLVPSLQKCLIEAVQQFGQQTKTRQMQQTLKELTGLPPSKAVRALIVWGVLAVGEKYEGVTEGLSGEELERRLRGGRNPYDILLHSQSPSLLDIGAGDLTFEQELVDQYVPQLRSHNKMLRLHAFDRLTPGSRLGGVYHKNPDYEGYLKSFPVEELTYQFWGGMDLEQFCHAKDSLLCYTMVTCHAPANPTFAYEPSRVESSLILKHLQATRGHFHPGRLEGESVLEVSHQDKILTFPPWKFNIIGPLALLELMGKRGQVGVLSAIDDEVFWEILSQILADDQFRPRNKIFTKDNIPEVFGDVYKELSSLAIGGRVDLSKIAELRDLMPFGAKPLEKTSKFSKFRYVEIRRGAFWEGIPNSFTAKQFSQMREESTPWWIIFIPDV
jgi:hypothetical protein